MDEMKYNDLIRHGERIDDLQLGGLKIIQNPEWFCFGIDAVLLSNFSSVKDGQDVVEFGTGTGIIPILLAGKTKAKKITAFEIQPEVAQMAQRSVEMNGLGERIEIVNEDLKNVLAHVSKSSVDVVVTNPPYFIANGGIKNPHSVKAISRHEVKCTVDDILANARDILKPGGAFYMVHRPNRLVDIVWAMRQNRIEPKEIRFVQPKRGDAPNIMLIKGIRGGRPELKFLDPLVVYNDDGSFTEEIFKIYSEERIDSFENQR